MQCLCFDIEANGLLYEADHIWMIAGLDETNHWHLYTSVRYPEVEAVENATHYLSISEYLNLLQDADKIVAHNLFGYDYPLLEKLYGFHKPIDQCDDTQIMSSLFEPDVRGGHSLGAWGTRLNMPKGDHNEWDKFSPEMFTYGLQDVRILKRVYRELTHDMEKSETD